MLTFNSPIDPAQSGKRDTISARACIELREAIVTARLKPGTSISETEVAKSMGISRTPVREAFARLFDEGLIEISPQSGTLVSRIDMQRVREAVFIRSALESAVVARTDVTPDPAALDELEMLLREQERSIDKNDRAALHRADMRFHSGLMRAFAVERAWTACLHVSADMMRVQFLIGMRRDHIEAIVEEHKGVLAAVRAGDPALASARLAAHIRNVDIDQADLKALNADYFRLSEEI
ncbi:DNA-binding GntR family transcriptional regulator [Kaistia hirudinis]|uniref:DNA-binding GntR family transcriptional regulator n=1 Tax=Kaistia hirudinis TaxID=1293440 RepID=A0A840APC2_9HYPH|nr:GntR family transcriptional regulator [Kaistia hirudinis]MBB3930256.1 DNA-binding GntR family transcriptional regulator [Kaistia hirudinis]